MPDHDQFKAVTGVGRYALSFVVKAGSEEDVARILSSYGRPATDVNPQTRLLRTSVFMHGSRVVRSMDVQGDHRLALGHLAAQPAVRAVEAALNEHLVEPRNMEDPIAARAFFARSSLPRVDESQPVPDGQDRRGLLVPVLAGRGAEVSAALHGLSLSFGGGTVFCRGDVVVWMLDGPAPIDDWLADLARYASADPAAARLTGALALDADLHTEQGWQRLFSAGRMRLLTDRRAGAPVELAPEPA
jgi:hypothetical protein